MGVSIIETSFIEATDAVTASAAALATASVPSEWVTQNVECAFDATTGYVFTWYQTRDGCPDGFSLAASRSCAHTGSDIWSWAGTCYITPTVAATVTVDGGTVAQYDAPATTVDGGTSVATLTSTIPTTSTSTYTVNAARALATGLLQHPHLSPRLVCYNIPITCPDHCCYDESNFCIGTNGQDDECVDDLPSIMTLPDINTPDA